MDGLFLDFTFCIECNEFWSYWIFETRQRNGAGKNHRFQQMVASDRSRRNAVYRFDNNDYLGDIEGLITRTTL